MRIFLVLLLAGSAASAQKPGGDGAPPAPAAWRLTSLAACTADLAGGSIDPDDARQICDCALDRVVAEHGPSDLPPIVQGRLGPALGAPLMSCAASRQPRLVGAIAERLAGANTATEVPALPAPAGDGGGKPGADTPPAPARASAPDFQTWWRSIDASGWFDGMPLWAWLPLALFAIIVLRLVLGRDKERGRDLIGPPPNMRPRGAPPRPRR